MLFVKGLVVCFGVVGRAVAEHGLEGIAAEFC
jgi:hypothetical protein